MSSYGGPHMQGHSHPHHMSGNMPHHASGGPNYTQASYAAQQQHPMPAAASAPAGSQAPTSPFIKQQVNLSQLSGLRVGVDGNWFLATLRSQMKRQDPYWALNGPVSGAFDELVALFLKMLKDHSVTPVFVFDGLYTVRQSHQPHFSTHLDDNIVDVHDWVRNHAQFDEDVTPYLIRLLVTKDVEVITAPYLAWAQLVYLASSNLFNDGDQEASNEPYITEVFGPLEILAFNQLSRVLVEPGDWASSQKPVFFAFQTPNTTSGADKIANFLFHPSRIDKSQYWFWNMPAPMTPHAGGDPGMIKNTLNQCPVFTLDGQVKPFAKVRGDSSVATLMHFFFKNLHAERPVVYYLLANNVISSSLLNVVSSEMFVDDMPMIFSQQYSITNECIIPLRTQIVCQLIQDLQNYLVYLGMVGTLLWRRNGSKDQLPIQRPPKIVLDDWRGIDPNREHDFVTVLEYAANAVPPPVPFVNDGSNVMYQTAKEGRAAVLLKALDLLGYFTHAAHAGADVEESSKSIFATALEHAGPGFGEEAVLLIELSRTRSLTDEPLGVKVHSSLEPPPVAPGVRFAARILSLVHLTPDFSLISSSQTAPKREFSMDLLAFNEIARGFQRNLRQLTEAVAASQILCHTAGYELIEMRDFATKLPFKRPLTTHGGVMAEYMLTDRDFISTVEPNRKLALLQAKFPYMGNIKEKIQKLWLFWSASMEVLRELQQDEEAEPEMVDHTNRLIEAASQIVGRAFHGLVQLH